jgi:glucosamine-6-phosphate deaminase
MWHDKYKDGAPQPAQTVHCGKLPATIFSDSHDAARFVAVVIANLIREKNASGQKAVLGLATGSTPIGVYRELVRMHKAGELDFSNVVTFNLDEYWPMQPESEQSYHTFMWENLFSHVNIPPDNVHIPSGLWKPSEIEHQCAEYERKIAQFGGLDFQLLGIGRDGHIGFNEPGSERNSRTRLVALDPMTRRDAAGDFGGEDKVPARAITMGVQTIWEAKRIFLMALGEKKAFVIRKALEGEPTSSVPASFLQNHLNTVFVLDEGASAQLTQIRTPWIGGRMVEWTLTQQKQAMVWLSQVCEKPLLKLDMKDFLQHHLYDILHLEGGVAAIRQRVFNDLLATICPKPGGDRPLKVMIFSPHPDDDVISMGGTFITLVNQGHEVHVAYMTSGNIAVRDDACLRHIDYVEECSQRLGGLNHETAARLAKCRAEIQARKFGEHDSADVLTLKGLIRKTEAVNACELIGVPEKQLHFLELPFYQTGSVKKRPIGEDDIQIVTTLLREQRPEQIYFAGDLSDPHGTHRVCAQIIIETLKRLDEEGYSPEVWMYRGAWQEFEPHEIERAVPLSPEVLLKKKQAILRHESQKDGAMFMGSDDREFWMRAEERTKQTAQIFDKLGLPEFFALEGFVRYRGQKL